MTEYGLSETKLEILLKCFNNSTYLLSANGLKSDRKLDTGLAKSLLLCIVPGSLTRNSSLLLKNFLATPFGGQCLVFRHLTQSKTFASFRSSYVM